MDWKIILPILLSFMLVFSVFAGCTQETEDAVDAIRNHVKALPTVEEFRGMDDKDQQKVYMDTQAAYDAYMALNTEQQAQLEEELKIIETLFAYFNAQIMPIE